MGLDGFEFVEFSCPNPSEIATAFEIMGFTAVAKHKSRDITLFKQGDIIFLLNAHPEGHAADFFNAHGPSACSMAFRVADSKKAIDLAVKRGAEVADFSENDSPYPFPAIKGIGGALLYLTDNESKQSVYTEQFDQIAEFDKDQDDCGFHTLDHLTHNVFQGKMEYWADFYERLFGFREIRYFDIKGKKTGLLSKALMAPDRKIRIPLNEESSQGGGQIEEYLKIYKGEGIQHIALACDDLYAGCAMLVERGMKFMPAPPDAYYQMLDNRLPNHGEPVEELRKYGILVDGNTEDGEPRLLLQIFSLNMIGPIFFEFIQRKKDEGFGEGNFSALFDSIEQDQIQRGVLS